MAYTRYTKSNGSLRLVIDRMSLIICVICLVLSLVLAFVGGYLAGFNSRAAITRATIRPETAPYVASNPQPVAPAPVWEQPPPPDDEESEPPEAEAPESDYNHFEALTEVLAAPPQEAADEPAREAAPAEEAPDVEALVERVRAAQQERIPPPAAPVESSSAPERRVVDIPRASGGYTVQVGAFSNKDNADRMLAGVQAKGYRAEQVYTWFQRGNPVYCVWIEDYEDYGSAQAAAAQYREREGEDAVAVRRIVRVAAE